MSSDTLSPKIGISESVVIPSVQKSSGHKHGHFCLSFVDHELCCDLRKKIRYLNIVQKKVALQPPDRDRPYPIMIYVFPKNALKVMDVFFHASIGWPHTHLQLLNMRRIFRGVSKPQTICPQSDKTNTRQMQNNEHYSIIQPYYCQGVSEIHCRME